MPSPHHHSLIQNTICNHWAAAAAPASAILTSLSSQWLEHSCLTHGILDKHSTTHFCIDSQGPVQGSLILYFPQLQLNACRQRLSAQTLGSDIWHQMPVFATHFLCVLNPTSLHLSFPICQTDNNYTYRLIAKLTPINICKSFEAWHSKHSISVIHYWFF